jgi:hypothetical protein
MYVSMYAYKYCAGGPQHATRLDCVNLIEHLSGRI